MNTNQNELRLLPNYFKKIAWGLLAVILLIVILKIVKVLRIDTELLKNIIQSGVLLALLLLALTKNKIEDELTLKIRVSAFAGAFVFGVGFVVLYPFVYVIIGDGFTSNQNVFGLLVTMFFFYFGIFYSAKKNR